VRESGLSRVPFLSLPSHDTIIIFFLNLFGLSSAVTQCVPLDTLHVAAVLIFLQHHVPVPVLSRKETALLPLLPVMLTNLTCAMYNWTVCLLLALAIARRASRERPASGGC
jgi:hypothetical protein